MLWVVSTCRFESPGVLRCHFIQVVLMVTRLHTTSVIPDGSSSLLSTTSGGFSENDNPTDGRYGSVIVDTLGAYCLPLIVNLGLICSMHRFIP